MKEEKLQTSERKFPVPIILNAWTYLFSNIPELSFGVHTHLYPKLFLMSTYNHCLFLA